MLDAAEDALGDRPLSVLTAAGELVPVDDGARAAVGRRRRQLGGDGARGGRRAPRRAADRRRQHDRRHRPDRRRPRRRDRPQRPRAAAGRASSSTPACCAPTSRRSRRAVPVRGGWCPVASEFFAISADVHLVLGHLAPEAYDCPTPDGRPATVAFARERIARLVCADVEQLDAAEIDAIAAFLARRAGAPDRGRGAPRAASAAAEAPVVAVGSGAHPGARGRGAARASGRRSTRAVGGPAAAAAARGAAGGTLRERADRRQGRRRPRPRRRAAGVVRRARRARRAPRLLVVPGGGGFADAVRDADRRFGLTRRRPRTGWRSSAWSSSAGCCAI